MSGAIVLNNLGCPRCEAPWDRINSVVRPGDATLVARCANPRCRTEFAVHVTVAVIGVAPAACRKTPEKYHHACGLCGSLQHRDSECELAVVA